MKIPVSARWILLGILALAPAACEKSFRLGPQTPPSLTHVPTRTFTATSTPSLVLTNTPTASLTPTFTPTSSLTPTPTDSLTPTSTATDTPTPSPTDTATDTATPTNTVPTGPSIICTTTPVAPVDYNEAEAVNLGGPTGTNENCGIAENIGTIPAAGSVVVHGSLLASGNTGTSYDFTNDDVDMYAFTSGAAGDFTFTLDCFDDGTGTNDFDIYVVDPTCSTTYGADTTRGVPVKTVQLNAPSAVLPAVIIVVGWKGSAQSPYRMVVQSP